MDGRPIEVSCQGCADPSLLWEPSLLGIRGLQGRKQKKRVIHGIACYLDTSQGVITLAGSPRLGYLMI